MVNWFRQGLYAGLSVALILGFYLVWLWQPEHQVRLHSANILRAAQHHDWGKLDELINPAYLDQWGNDRAQVLERTREILRALRRVEFTASRVSVEIDGSRGLWQGDIKMKAETSEFSGEIVERFNAVDAPFVLEWRNVSWKPWDWRLVHVSNAGLKGAGEFN